MPPTNTRKNTISLQDLSDQLAHCSQMVSDCRNAAVALIEQGSRRTSRGAIGQRCCVSPEEGNLLDALRQFIKVEVAAQGAPQMAPAPYVTVALAAKMTGLSVKAIRRKIEDGKWLDGREYRRSPDGGLCISIKGFTAWVEQSQNTPFRRYARK